MAAEVESPAAAPTVVVRYQIKKAADQLVDGLLRTLPPHIHTEELNWGQSAFNMALPGRQYFHSDPNS